MRYLVYRKAVLPEDEGRELLVADCDNHEVAKEIIKSQSFDGYFSSADFYILLEAQSHD